MDPLTELEPLTRRDLVKGTVLGSMALGLGGLLSACGGSSGSSVTSSVTVGAPKRGGTLRAAITGGSSSDAINPLSPINNADYARVNNIFEGLTAATGPQAAPQLRLAESITPNATATAWTVRLRRGVEFHNGKELTAEDLIFTLRSILNPKSPGEGANGLAPIDVARLRKLDRHTVLIPCRRPFVTFPEVAAAAGALYVIPEGFDPKHPIGTGPFKLESFTAGQQSVLVRHPNYWATGQPYLERVVITDAPDEVSQINALIAGQADVVNGLSSDSLPQVRAAGKNILISSAAGWNPFTMRTDASPFNDVRVRQALRLAVDRQQILNLVYGGHGMLGNDVFGILAPEYDHSIPQRTQDIARAKSLLKSAGREGLSLELVTAPIGQGTVKSAQVFAQQLSMIGVTARLRQVTATDFFGSNYLKWPFAQDIWYYNYYLPQASFATLPTAPFNETHFSDARYTKLYNEAVATLDVTHRAALAHEMQLIDYDRGGYIIPCFPPVIDAYARNVHGLVPTYAGLSLSGWNFGGLWLA